MYDRILVPIDGSPTAHPAVDKALDLAHRHDAEITAIHVVQTERIASVPMESAWPGVTALARQEGESIMELLHDYLSSMDVSAETVLLEGSPSREIVRSANRLECDIIVMATSGRVGLNRLLLGSVTERVVRQSPVPVLTVPRPTGTSVEESPVDANASG